MSKVITITGGSGSFGSAMTKFLLSHTDYKIRVMGRSESRLSAVQSEISSPRVTFILSDIRDKDRLSSAFKGTNYIFHAAALKIVSQSYIHTSEFLKTNILGTQNVISAARENSVERVLFVSSDKGCQPLSPYGISKSFSEHSIVEANMHTPYQTRYASVRGGNIWASRGSVMEKWSDINKKSIEVHSPDTTRFHLSMSSWLNFCFESMNAMHGGEIFIPKCRSWRLGTLAEAYAQSFQKEIITYPDNRDGDKEHETLISEHELRYAKDLSWCYVIEPVKSIREVWNYEPHKGYEVPQAVSSNTAARMGIDELRSVIRNGG